ncbi:MAG: V-type ATP synthase subunit D [Eubacteriales bacterium]|nr:V-type ATP synthase subunit D [Clostridiales bacterium]MDY5836772.1 V-type ATP synthase subunit D [Eubacteriales bacterium]
MARLNVSPTRMVLQDLTRRLATAKRGHKLLKDKQDELMRNFIVAIRKNMTLRDQVEEALSKSFKDFMLASAVMSPERLEQAVSFSKFQVVAAVEKENMMSVHVPSIRFHQQALPGFGPDETGEDPGQTPASSSQPMSQSYGYAQTTVDLDEAISSLHATMDMLLELAELEKVCQLLAADIESTRRRVNALEYRTIPNLEETITYIRMKLDENERATITRLMKVKDMISEEGAL